MSWKHTTLGILFLDKLLPTVPLEGIFCVFLFCVSVERSKILDYNTITKMASLENSTTSLLFSVLRGRNR